MKPTKETKHTPLLIGPEIAGTAADAVERNPDLVAIWSPRLGFALGGVYAMAGNQQIAEEIVQAVDHHAELVEALEGLLQYSGGWDVKATDHPIYKARAILAKLQP